MGFDRYTKQKTQTNESYYFPITLVKERDTDIYVQYTIGDRLDHISYKFYGDPSYWWVIMLANPKYSIEFDIEVGDIIRIPFPLNDVIAEVKPKL